jgi:hypothetical protein
MATNFLCSSADDFHRLRAIANIFEGKYKILSAVVHDFLEPRSSVVTLEASPADKQVLNQEPCPHPPLGYSSIGIKHNVLCFSYPCGALCSDHVELRFSIHCLDSEGRLGNFAPDWFSQQANNPVPPISVQYPCGYSNPFIPNDAIDALSKDNPNIAREEVFGEATAPQPAQSPLAPSILNDPSEASLILGCWRVAAQIMNGHTNTPACDVAMMASSIYGSCYGKSVAPDWNGTTDAVYHFSKSRIDAATQLAPPITPPTPEPEEAAATHPGNLSRPPLGKSPAQHLEDLACAEYLAVQAVFGYENKWDALPEKHKASFRASVAACIVAMENSGMSAAMKSIVLTDCVELLKQHGITSDAWRGDVVNTLAEEQSPS